MDSETVLALFIREQVHTSSPIRGRQSVRFRLVEQLTVTDEFGTWPYDHFRGLFDLELRRCSNEPFPNSWTLADHAGLRCRVIFIGSGFADEKLGTTVADRPRTTSLDQFVLDVCDKEDNQPAEAWIKCLREEDIRTFSHLLNLKQTEWDNIKKLSMNAKRILKAAVDRERESVANDRRHVFEQSSPDQSVPSFTSRIPCHIRLSLNPSFYAHL